MPLIYFNCPEKTFLPEIKDTLAEELTAIALKVEKLPDTDCKKYLLDLLQ